MPYHTILLIIIFNFQARKHKIVVILIHESGDYYIKLEWMIQIENESLKKLLTT